MRATTRLALGAATAVALAATAVVPSGAAPRDDGTATGPLAGGTPVQGGTSATVTLVTGDRVTVTTDATGRSTALVLPGADGESPLVQTRQYRGDLYVYPDTAAEALADGLVDEELFNVTGLIRQGYDDAHTDTLPLIAQYDGRTDLARSAPPAPRGAERGMALPAVDGVALTAAKDTAAQFWRDVTTPGAKATSSTPSRLWLDRKVTATLDRSTRQVRADRAWAGGLDGTGTQVAVLDTGADAAHPDLKDRIGEAKDFTGSPSGPGDRDGHGTHVASTVGGSGTASGGRNRGVAPGTSLLVGKVLDDSGSGQSSWIIAGMQWAVDRGADVASMSLGSSAIGACDDPMAQAARELAASTRTLFVVAAGNSGPGTGTVSSPGCVPEVLTVGAVDRDDSTAPFSSRGPVAATHTLKPELAAPGVAIAAARAGGRGVYAYTGMSGTSMATPHVAGAAAIVRQAHPDWTAQQVKAALVGSARTGGEVADAGQVGAGVLDVAAATGRQVTSAPAVQAGTFAWPQTPADRTTVKVPFTNASDRPVTLDLDLDGVRGNDGSRVTTPVARLTDRRITVRPGATVHVPLLIDPTARLRAAQYGAITGRVLATGHGTRVSVPFTLHIEPETVTLTVRVLDRDGEPAAGASSLDVVSLDADRGERRPTDGTVQTYRIRPGDYLISAFAVGYDPAGAPGSVAYLGRPQTRITEDTTLVLDARDAHRIQVATDRPSTVARTALSYARIWDDTWLLSGELSAGAAVKEYYASVDRRARNGTYEFRASWRAYGSDATTGPYVYNLSFPTAGPLTRPRTHHPHDERLARVTERWNAVGKEADYRDALSLRPSWSDASYVTVGLLDPVRAPGTRTAYYTTGADAWEHGAMSSFPWGAFLLDRDRTYAPGDRRTEEWYRGVLRPAAPRDADGKPVLAAEWQGDLMGFRSAFWVDGSGEHWSPGASFGDIGNLVLERDGEEIGRSAWPFGAFEVPAGDARYELTQNLMKLPTSDRNWLRSTAITTTWGFRSHLEEDVRSRGLPILFPSYDVPVDALNRAAAEPAVRIGVTAEGHAGYTPGTLTDVSVSYSYDGGTTWTEADTTRDGGAWTAVLDHSGASGEQVTLKAEITDDRGNTVTQQVTRAYDVR